jgi:tetratricopeptide (TPR) repeat protein
MGLAVLEISKNKIGYVIGIAAIFIFMLILFVYTPALKNDFVWDDREYVSQNTLIRSLTTHSLYSMLTSFSLGNWHPLTSYSHAIDYAFWDLEPHGHHFTNIILHALNTLLVFLLVIKLVVREKKVDEISLTYKMPLSIKTKSAIIAGITALFFGLHPLHVESVAWVSERKDLLCAFFFLLTLLCYLSYASLVDKRHRWIWFTACLFLFICALMSKPMAVSLPVILLLLDNYPLRRSTGLGKNSSVLLEKIPFVALSIASSIVTIIAQRSGGALATMENFPLTDRLLNALRAIVFYIEKMILPVGLVPFYPLPKHIHFFDTQYLLSGIFLLIATGLCLWMLKRGRHLFFITWSYYVVTLLPVLGIIQVGMQSAADRYTYLPSISICLLAGIGVFWIFEKCVFLKHKGITAVFLIFIFTILFLLSQLTITQIKIWQNSESLWTYVTRTFPKSASLPHYNLGNALLRKGRIDEALTEYKRALSVNPRDVETYNNLGIAYKKKGMLNEAIYEFKKVLTIKPDHAGAHYNLGSVYLIQGNWDEAILEIKQSLLLTPNHAESHSHLGSAYLKKGEVDKAITEYKHALLTISSDGKVHNNLAIAYYLKKNYKLAIIHSDKAVAFGITPNPQLLELLEQYR